MRDEGEGKCAVRSPGSEDRHEVKLSNKGRPCTCEYAEHRKFHCKHSRAVENTAMLTGPGEKFRIDGTCVKAGGDAAYLHIVIDAARDMVSYLLTPKAHDDVSAVLRDAEKAAGKKPTLLVSDSDWAYRAAWKSSARTQRRAEKDAPPPACARQLRHQRDGEVQLDVSAFLDRMRGLTRTSLPLLEWPRARQSRVCSHERLGETAPDEDACITVNGRRRPP